MTYKLGEFYTCDVEQSEPKTVRLIDLEYHIHTPEENQRFLNILNSDMEQDFDREWSRAQMWRKTKR